MLQVRNTNIILNDFTLKNFICPNRFIRKPVNFHKAINFCKKSANNINQELIPIDKLRYFQQEGTQKFNIRGLVRVNAIKYKGKWLEYSNNRFAEISFQHFDYDPQRGIDGDSLGKVAFI